MGILDQVSRVIKEASEHQGFHEFSEADTCEQIILPLMEIAGYSRRQRRAQVSIPGSGYIDYVIDADGEPIVVEAKRCSAVLQDRDVIQALNYANANGGRWAILTNGTEWRLYDNAIQGAAPRKQVWLVKTEEDLAELISALGPSSVVSGGLERIVEGKRLAIWLKEQLCNAESEVIAAVVKVANSNGFKKVKANDIVAVLSNAKMLPPLPLPPPPPLTDDRKLSAIEQWGRQLVRTKPRLLVCGAETVSTGPHWASLLYGAIKWLDNIGRLPAPPLPLNDGRYIYATDPNHPTGKGFTAPSTTPVATAHGPIYIEYDWSAERICRCLHRLFGAAGYDLDMVAIEFIKLT
ncbi:MAG: hypothetical protein HUU60_11260 [Armatimonadetes bacterium]|nr:hypothetical protein [Armatimonadota bacterium]